MERPGPTRPPRWLVLLAGALVWTSADGQRHVRRHARPAPRPIARCVTPPASPPVVEYYYPADPAQP